MKPVSLFITPLYTFPFTNVLFTKTSSLMVRNRDKNNQILEGEKRVKSLDVYLKGCDRPIPLFEENVTRFHHEFATWCEVTS